MEQEINQAVQVLVKHGIQLMAISSSESREGTKISVELSVTTGIDPTQRHFVKAAFESAWFQLVTQASANGHDISQATTQGDGPTPPKPAMMRSVDLEGTVRESPVE